MSRTLIDLKGKKFGRWTVLPKHTRTPNGKIKWLCRCECGVERMVLGGNLLSHLTQSCGCLQIEIERIVDPKELDRLYWWEEWKVPQIAKHFGVWEATIYACMKRYGIKRRGRSMPTTCVKCGLATCRYRNYVKINRRSRWYRSIYCAFHYAERKREAQRNWQHKRKPQRRKPYGPQKWRSSKLALISEA